MTIDGIGRGAGRYEADPSVAVALTVLREGTKERKEEDVEYVAHRGAMERRQAAELRRLRDAADHDEHAAIVGGTMTIVGGAAQIGGAAMAMDGTRIGSDGVEHLSTTGKMGKMTSIVGDVTGRSAPYAEKLFGGTAAERARVDAKEHANAAEAERAAAERAHEKARDGADQTRSALDSLRAAIASEHEARMGILRA